jgi:hypothetical protein
MPFIPFTSGVAIVSYRLLLAVPAIAVAVAPNTVPATKHTIPATNGFHDFFGFL